MRFSSRTEAHAVEAAEAAGKGARAAEVGAMVREVEMVLLTLPYGEIEKTLGPLRGEVQGKILVDVTNPITADHRALAIGHTVSGAEEIARAFPGARVVKAFNAVFAEVYASQKAEIGGRVISIFLCGG